MTKNPIKISQPQDRPKEALMRLLKTLNLGTSQNVKTFLGFSL